MTARRCGRGRWRGSGRTAPGRLAGEGFRRHPLVPALTLALLVAQVLAGCSLGGGPATTPTAGGGARAAPTTTTAEVATPTVGSLPGTAGTPRPVGSPAALGVARVLTPPARTARPTPRGDQTLTLAGPQATPTLDPALVRDTSSAFLAHQLFRGLVRLDEQLEPVPDLAERIEVAADGLSYTFTLRADATFHDGRPITAQAVKYSLERATDPALAARGGQLPGATYLKDIAGAADRLAGRARELRGVRVADNRTVVITLDSPQVSFLMKLSHPAAAVVDEANARAGATWWQRPNGSGPFRLDSLGADRLVLKRFDRFYGGAPALETVTVLLGQAAGEPMNLYEGGKIDYTRVPLSSVDRVLVDTSPLRAQLSVTPALSLTFVAFNPNVPPFDDPAVRRAFARALDRDKVARVSQVGKVVPARGIVPPDMPGGPWVAALPAHDPGAARAQLAASRYGAALPRTTIYTTSGGGSGAAETMQGVYGRDLGVTLEVVGIEWEEYLEGLSARAYPAFELTWVADYPDPDNFLAVLFAGDSGENHGGYRNPEVDRLFATAAVERDPERRRALYLEAQQRILDDAVVIPLYHTIDYTLVKPHVKGLTITAMGVLELDTVWIER